MKLPVDINYIKNIAVLFVTLFLMVSCSTIAVLYLIECSWVYYVLTTVGYSLIFGLYYILVVKEFMYVHDNMEGRVKDMATEIENTGLSTASEVYNEHIWTITHEIRSPLAVITAAVKLQSSYLREIYNDAYKSGLITGDNVENYKGLKNAILSIDRNVNIIADFINGIVNHADNINEETEGQRFIEASTYMTSVLESARNFSRTMKIIDNKNLGFHKDSYDDFDKVHILANQHDLTRILMNIFKNSSDAIWQNIDFLKKRRPGYKPSLKLRCLKSTHIDTAILLNKEKVMGPFGCDREESPFYLVIEDNGPGISEENREKIFTKNFSTQSGLMNLGLGLHICMKIAKDNDISMYFQTDESRGTRLILGFPRVILLEESPTEKSVGVLCMECEDLMYSSSSHRLYDDIVDQEVISSYSLVPQSHQNEH